MRRYDVSKSVIVSIRGGRNYKQFTKWLKPSARRFSRITPEQIKLIRTRRGSNRIIAPHWVSH
jgi:hypothetical protein